MFVDEDSDQGLCAAKSGGTTAMQCILAILMAMHPSYANAMPPTPPGYPYFPTPQPHYWQPPEAYHGTPQEFDAYGNQAAWPDQIIEPDQGWTNENDNSAQVHRDFDVVTRCCWWRR